MFIGKRFHRLDLKYNFVEADKIRDKFVSQRHTPVLDLQPSLANKGYVAQSELDFEGLLVNGLKIACAKPLVDLETGAQDLIALVLEKDPRTLFAHFAIFVVLFVLFFYDLRLRRGRDRLFAADWGAGAASTKSILRSSRLTAATLTRNRSPSR